MASIFKTENCPICGCPTGASKKTSVKCDGLYICQDCGIKINKSGIGLINARKMTANEIRARLGNIKTSEEMEKEVSEFQITKQVGDYFYLDQNQNKFAIPILTEITRTVKGMNIYNCEDIIDFELIEDGDSISKGGVGRALIGGALFGGVGAIVGGSTGHKQKKTCTKLQIKITMNSIDKPTVYIDLVNTELKRNTMLFRMAETQAQEIMSLLNVICMQEGSNDTLQPQASSADEILKFKALLDQGIITEEEFSAKKKQLLGI